MTPNRPTITDTPEHQPGPTSRRIKITLPTVLADKLDQLARRSGEPPAKVAAQLIRRAIDNEELDAAPPTRRDATRNGTAHDDDGASRPPWLEPYGGSREWRGLTWGAIVGLHARYPDTLAALGDGWWRNASHLETLSALAVWRQSIDDAGRDPREELSFQIQLANFGQLLHKESGGILNRWEPGAPPVEWS